MNREELLKRIDEKYSKLNYTLISKEDYFKKYQKIEINCPSHGSFFKTISNFVYGKNKSPCQKCSYEELSKRFSCTESQFGERLIKKFGNRFEILSFFFF